MSVRRSRILLSLSILFTLSDAIVSQAGVTFATHGHNDFSAFGADPDLMSTEAYLVPNISDTISNRVGVNETAVIEVSGTRNGGEWAFEETLRTPVPPGDSPAIHELVVLMNWESAANGSVSAQEVGDAFAGFVLKNRPEWVSRFGSIAVTGHSRGATFVDGFTSSLGTSNVLVDSVAYLDAVPNSGFGDVTPTHRDNVVFAQSIKQEGLFTGLNLSGATNIDISGLLSGLPGFPQVDLGDDPHFAVLVAFGDTIDQTRTSSLPYGGTNPERNGFGGEYFHFGNLAHDRPLDGLHPTAGGEAATSGVTFGEDELWPAITMTQESRARLLLMSDDKRIDVIYRDPDSESLTLRILADEDSNLFDGFASEILQSTLDGGQSEWMLLENLDLTIHGDDVAWLHLELSDGVLTSHATFPMTLTADDVCDFDSNDVCDVVDIDLLFASGDISEGVPVPPGDVAFDINGDDIIDNGDADQWLAAAASENGFAAPFSRGDANLDGTVDAADLNALALNWRGSGAVWSGGDFTGEGRVNATDLNSLALNWRSSVPVAAAKGVPEPCTGLLASFGMLAVIALRRQRHQAGSRVTPLNRT